MKNLIYLTLLFAYIFTLAQPNTEVYLFERKNTKGVEQLVNLKNISNNEGYDNQPSFYDEQTILFTSTRNQQTDIKKYEVKEGTSTWVTDSPVGSEYSPLKIPGQNAVSSIRLDTTGLQRLYSIDLESGKATALLKDLVVGYHVWYSEDILLCSVLEEEQMNLVIANLKDKTNYTVAKNVGRSLHKIPNAKLVSYISKEEENWTVKSIDPHTAVSKEIVRLPQNIQDMCWLSDGSILLPRKNEIIKFNPETDKDWSVWYSFEEKEISNISRMAISPDETKLCLVSEIPLTMIVDQQVETFNKAELDGFAACFSEDVLVQNFPTDTMYVGNAKLKASYERYFAKNSNTKVEVVKRILMGAYVIDEEKVKVDDKTYHQAAVYKIENGKIAEMTFIHSQGEVPDVDKSVKEQLTAYNARNLEDFAKAFSEDVKAYNYPDKLLFDGKEQMKNNFTKWFEETLDLHCEIKNRMIVGNVVIDEEFITANGGNFRAAAIYQVKDGKISSMRFIR